jgi:hypothetical protein
VKRNITAIDDWLIRVGFLVLAGSMLESSCSSDAVASAGSQFFRTALLIGGAVTLAVGYVVRWDERRIAQVWRILEHSTEVKVEEVSYATGFDQEFLLRAVRTINRQPNAYYVWDRAAGTIVDGRMRSQVLAVDQCESCGAMVNEKISLDLANVPSCTHCNGPVTVQDLNRLKTEGLRELRAKAEQTTPSFSLPLFLVLLFTFWPAAIVYLIWSRGVFDRLLGRVSA